MGDTITVRVAGKEIEIKKGISLWELSKYFQDDFQSSIIIAMVDYQLKELSYCIQEPCDIVFLDISDKDGYKTYQRSLSMVLIKAVRDVLGDASYVETIIHYSINSGLYCEILFDGTLTKELIDQIRARMKEMIDKDLRFEKNAVKVDVAKAIFKRQNMEDKLDLFVYRRSSMINLTKLDGFYDYFYGHIAMNTGCLQDFELYPYDEGIVLQFVTRNEPKKVSPFNPDQKLFETLKRTTRWGEVMDVETVGALNKVISEGKMNELILVSEALMEKRIAQIADKIIEGNPKKRFVFIAGPSSSGKTTFAGRLSIQLRAHGIRPHIISMDNYFVNRDKTPRDHEGKYDFECLEALDLESFNLDMTNLLTGKTVDIPSFNFISGEREYKGNLLHLEEDDILIIEGIHGLNNRVSYSIPADSKFKIYISALTQLNVDYHNRIPTTDARLIRRLVRDNEARGASAARTIGMWESVRRGEENYIFPFQEQADAMFNSVLIYELSVLKQFAEPLLFNVPRNSEAYTEARRLIKLLDYFLGVTSDKIPYNSILREFIGGSCF